MSQNDPKATSLITSVTKNLQPPTKKFFFECNLGKATENYCFFAKIAKTTQTSKC